MEQAKALNALEPFLALSKSATSPRAAADLITRATSAPGTFIFAELLAAPQIQALAGAAPELAAHLTLLHIFSYGTYETYASTPGLPALADAQASKLRQLSLLTLARDNRASLSYARLMQSLALPTQRALEDLVIAAVYAGLLAAQLDPARQVVQVSSVAPLRDVAPGAVPDMIAALRAWSARCQATLDELEAQIAGIRREAARKAAEKQRWDATITRLVEDEKASQEGGGGGGGGGGHAAGKKPMTLSTAHGKPRFGKRGSSLLNEPMATEDDDEAMDLDDDDEADGKKRTSRRKL